MASAKTSLLIMLIQGVAEEQQNPPTAGHATRSETVKWFLSVLDFQIFSAFHGKTLFYTLSSTHEWKAVPALMSY